MQQTAPAEEQDRTEPTEESSVLPTGENDELSWVLCEETHEKTVYSDRSTTRKRSKKQRFMKYLRKSCSLQAWRRRIPITLWLPKYSWQDLKGDFIAGTTVGMTCVPQALAYSQIADLPLEYGLYSSFMGCFVYSIFGGSKDVTLGVTAVVSLLTSSAIPEDADVFERTKYAVLMSFLVGLFQIALGVFHLGFLFRFISHPVLSGFTTASGFIIMFSQIKYILGVKGGSSTNTVIQQGATYVQNISKIRGWDVLVGMVCISFLLLIRRINFPKNSKAAPLLQEFVKLLVSARYGIVIVLATIVGFVLCLFETPAISLTADIDTSLPPFKFPLLTWRNETFLDHFNVVIPTIPFIVLIGAMETVAIAQAFGHKFGYSVDPSQELVALGLANFFSSLVSSYPICGSFTRSSLNAQSGVRTPMGCIFTGFFVVFAQATMSQAFHYVPKAALGAVIIAAVLMLIDVKIFKEIWLTRPVELIPLCGTILCSLFLGLDTGFLIGIGLSLALLLFDATKPTFKLQYKTYVYRSRDNPRLSRKVTGTIVTPQGKLFFPAAEAAKNYFIAIPRRNEIFERQNLRHGNGLYVHANGSVNSIEADSIKRQETNEKKDLNGCMELCNREEANEPTGCNRYKPPIIEETIIFEGHELSKLDFTSLRALHSTVDQYQLSGYGVKFVETEMKLLRLILPKRQLLLLPAAKKPTDHVTILISPPSWENFTLPLEEVLVE